MRMHCGSIGDVHPYQRIQRPGRSNQLQGGAEDVHLAIQLGQKQQPQPQQQKKKKEKKQQQQQEEGKEKQRTSSSSVDAKMVGSESQREDAITSSARGSFAHIAMASQRISHGVSTELPQRKVGLVDILMGYHALLQATPASSILTSRRKEVYPTIGFGGQAPRSRS